MIPSKIKDGQPIRLHDLNIIGLAEFLHAKGIRTTQGKVIQPLHEAHKEILADEARYKVLAAGRRFSKSLLAALVAIGILMQPNRRVWIVGPTYNHAEKVYKEVHTILVNQLKLVVPGKKGSVHNQKGDYMIKTPWESVLEAKSMERPDSLAGEALDFIIVDEAALQPNLEDVWTQMLGPTLMDKKGGALIISSPRGRNDFYKMYLLGQLGLKQKQGTTKIEIDKESKVSNDMREWSSFRKTSYDNPLMLSTPEESKAEIDNKYREALLSGKVVKFKQEYLADFEAVSDIVFPQFIQEPTEQFEFANVIDYEWHPDEGEIISSCDLNYAKPASTLFIQVNKFGDAVVFDELFTPHTTSYMQAQQILEKEKELSSLAVKIWNKEGLPLKFHRETRFKYYVCDIAGDQSQLHGRTAFDDFEEVLGKRPVGLKQPRETGCDMIRHRLQFPILGPNGRPVFREDGEPKTAPKLFINRNCTNLIYALASAKFKKTKYGILKEDYEETPQGYEGLLDALRYALVYLFHDRGLHFSITNGF